MGGLPGPSRFDQGPHGLSPSEDAPHPSPDATGPVSPCRSGGRPFRSIRTAKRIRPRGRPRGAQQQGRGAKLACGRAVSTRRSPDCPHHTPAPNATVKPAADAAPAGRNLPLPALPAWHTSSARTPPLPAPPASPLPPPPLGSLHPCPLRPRPVNLARSLRPGPARLPCTPA